MPAKPRTQQRPPTPARESRLTVFGRGRAVFAAVSVLVVIPCLWQSRVQAGDLGSHIYNAWLAQLIRQGRAPGLEIVPQYTNVLFDLMLSGLMSLFGVEAAQRIAASAAVLVVFWGAFAFVSVVAGRRAWDVAPLLALLAYGWVFHMGLFNFYLSLGMSFGALALAWNYRPWRLLAAGAMLLFALTGHGLPVVWAVAILAYRWIAQRMPPARIRYLVAGAFIAVAALHTVMPRAIQTRWSPAQLLLVTGADQALVYDNKYWIVFFGLLACWIAMAIRVRPSLSGIPFQICLLTAAGIFFIPTWAFLPQYKHALVYIAERMSLALGVAVCAALATIPAAKWHRYAAVVVAMMFFVFLYKDEHALNKLEDQIADAAAQAPAGARVVTAIQAPQLRANPIDHMIDRDCLGHCYSYANYEPSTAQFRIHVTGPNPIIAATYGDSFMMQSGRYTVKPEDVPLYRIGLDQFGRPLIESLPAGTVIGASVWSGI